MSNREPEFYRAKYRALKTHLNFVEGDEQLLQYVLEKVGERIDEESKHMANGILAGLGLVELKQIFDMGMAELAEVQKPKDPTPDLSEHTKEAPPKKPNARRSKNPR
jgi:hypothetical protein